MEPAVTTTSQEYQNENVRFTVHERPSCVVELDVEVLSPLLKQARTLSVKTVSKEVSLPGFRKGKAPAELVEENYAAAIQDALGQQVAQCALRECLPLVQLRLLEQEPKLSFQMKSLSANGALLRLFLEVEPKIPRVDPKNMVLKSVPRPEVNADKVNETIKQILLFFAHWESVEGRPIQRGDFVLLDVDVVEEASRVPLFSETRFEVTEKSMAKWMLDLVLGKQKGDVVEGVSIPDPDASIEDQKLTPKPVSLVIRSVDSATLPALDDSFASKVGAASVEDMHNKVTDLLNAQATAHVLAQQREQVSDFLLREYPFELPRTLVNKETEFRFRQLWNDSSFQTYWQGLSQEDQRNMVTTVQVQSEKAVRLFYLCRQIISDAQIEIRPEDVQDSPMDIISTLVNVTMSPKQASPEMQRAEAYSRLLLDKAEDFVIQNARSE